MQANSLLDTPVQYVPHVGPSRANLLKRLEIRTVEQLLYTPPFRYEDRSQCTPIAQLSPGAHQTTLGRIEHVDGRRTRHRRFTVVNILLRDASGMLRATWFNQPYLAQRFAVGQCVILYGKVEGAAQPQMMSPAYELVRDDEDDMCHMGRIVPIYSTTARLSQRQLRQVVWHALERFSYRVVDPLPAAIRRAHQLIDLPNALRALHFPPDWAALERARQRLAFDECLTIQVVMAMRRQAIADARKPQRYQLPGPLTTQFVQRLPFALTEAQRVVLDACHHDLLRAQPMNRLLQGEVGSGKTVLAIWAMLAAVQSGWQTVLMAPTELLAEQHARTIRAFLEPLGVEVLLLSRSVPTRQRHSLVQHIASGAPMIVIGTHTLIQDTVPFARLALIVIDEQHKFGVVQRAQLRAKGTPPDVLIMTATPIPRTLAMTVYSDVDISTVRELPPGRQPVETRWFRESMRQELYALLRRTCAEGHQAYVVYPAIDDTPNTELKAATQMAKELQGVFADVRVGLVHGRLDAAKRRRIMQAFINGQVQLLVSTSVIEVGIDVPNATVMVLEHAERFGLAQLHQLRGRIGRGPFPSLCVAMSDTTGEDAVARLQAFVQLRDGFALAERDLALRGPGHVLGTRQHGVPELKFACLLTDQPMVQAARAEARQLVQSAAVSGGAPPWVQQLLQKYHHVDFA